MGVYLYLAEYFSAKRRTKVSRGFCLTASRLVMDIFLAGTSLCVVLRLLGAVKTARSK